MRLRQGKASPGVGGAKVKASSVPSPDTHRRDRGWGDTARGLSTSEQ